MAITATEIYRRYPDFYRAEVRDIFERGHDPFQPSRLVMTREASESIALNDVKRAIILAGSGMCTGGRVRHHIAHNISHRHASIVFVGFAAQGTLARHIIDGAKTVRVFGEEHRVRAGVYTINGFSAHAGRQELLDWQRDVHAEETFLVHGEKPAMKSMAKKLPRTEVRIPKLHQTFSI
jgi:metallo-beta-lactamase family protein